MIENPELITHSSTADSEVDIFLSSLQNIFIEIKIFNNLFFSYTIA